MGRSSTRRVGGSSSARGGHGSAGSRSLGGQRDRPGVDGPQGGGRPGVLPGGGGGGRAGRADGSRRPDLAGEVTGGIGPATGRETVSFRPRVGAAPCGHGEPEGS